MCPACMCLGTLRGYSAPKNSSLHRLNQFSSCPVLLRFLPHHPGTQVLNAGQEDMAHQVLEARVSIQNHEQNQAPRQPESPPS